MIHPYIYLLYLTMLGYDQPAGGNAHSLNVVYGRTKHINRLRAEDYMGYSFKSLVEGIIHNKRSTARAKYIYQEEQMWTDATARGFIDFLGRIGAK